MSHNNKRSLSRRDFITVSALTGAGWAVAPYVNFKSNLFAQEKSRPATNIADAQKYPRKTSSMPGLFPGKVVQVHHAHCVTEEHFSETAVYDMIARGMLGLTGAATLKDAWRTFVSDTDRIGLKLNPVAGPTLSTSKEVVRAVLKQLDESGLPKNNIIIWDRREFELHECGFTTDNFPEYQIIGTECKDAKGSFYDEHGKLYGESRIDKNWYYWADVEESYDAETLPYMINQGKYSYFSRIVTEMCDKIINIPILKNAGSSVTLCLKNLAYGSVSNTGRLHRQLWSETSAEVCAFPPLRDKVVLNIVDGIKGCFNGGPGANPQFFTHYKTILMGSDPVAVDRIGYDLVIQKRIEEKIQKEDTPRGRAFMELAQNLQLGVADIRKIDLTKYELS